jgi:hypothetical protein
VTSSEPIPIAEIYRLREELALAIERQKWKTAKNRANAIIKLLPCAIHKDSKVSRVSAPHLDGIYNIGWQRFIHAPKSTRSAIEKMNDAIHESKKALPKMKKNKKKKK